MASLRCFGFDRGRAFQVGDRARDFQDAVVGARGKSQPLDGGFQQLFAVGGNRAVFADQSRRHLRVGVEFLFAAVALELNLRARAARVRARTAELSISASPRSSLYFTAGTSM